MLALRRDGRALEDVHAHVAEAISERRARAFVVVEINDEGVVLDTFGNALRGDLALAACLLTSEAAT